MRTDISCGLTKRQAASKFDIAVGREPGNQVWLEDRREAEWIVHMKSGRVVCRGKDGEIEFHHLLNETCDLTLLGCQPGKVGAMELRLHSRVKRDQAQRPTSVKDYMGGMRID